ncbi:SDR family NAD(P)-dependent oxidoreductase, partial [uncultured Pseudoalteromonas sp.]|uniref:SDR family NAD(P)-dependent oxidoreductase n=1 Tax=uncultured Pseudoalteromonas sp. TaxID=114053 RepID=UPI002632B384
MTKRILVTGSSRGIGKAIALRLANDGFDIAVHCRSGVAEAEQTCEEISALGRHASLLQFDVCDRERAKQQIEADIAEHGAYYGVICNAGITNDMAFPAMQGDDWDKVIRTGLDGFYNVVHPTVMPMVQARKGGRRDGHGRRQARRAQDAGTGRDRSSLGRRTVPLRREPPGDQRHDRLFHPANGRHLDGPLA